MMILVNVDFYGSDTELEVLTKAIKAFEKEEGVEFLGRYEPSNTKWHYTFFFKAKDMLTWASASKYWSYTRDRTPRAHNE